MKRTIAITVLIGLLFAGLGAYFGANARTGKTQAADRGTGTAAGAPGNQAGTSSSSVTRTVASTPADPAPATEGLFAQSMADPAGGLHALAQWKGRPVIVNFWATWCGPCVEEMPALSALQAELVPKHAQIIGIGIDSPTNIRDFMAKYKIAYPVYVAGMSGTELARQFGNHGGSLPYTVLIDAKGQVVKTYLGKLKMDELRRDVAAL